MLQALDNTGVSVVIVTFNGSKRIKPTLEHLALQTGIDFNWEVLLVDNNSTDNTALIAAETWEAHHSPCPLRIITEERPGTMYARHNGIVNAAYRYLLYCDDDNWLPAHYVKFAYDAIAPNNNIAVIGGCGTAAFEPHFTVPGWMKKYAGYFGLGPQCTTDGDTTHVKGCLYTAGAILDRCWLNKLYASGFKSVLKGRDGKSLMAGEDTELTYALRLSGGRLFYYSAMHFKHYMPPQRITWQYLRRLAKGVGKSNYLLKGYYEQGPSHLLKDYLISAGLVIKYFFKSIFSGFKEGNDNVIIFYTFLGQLQVLGSSKRYRQEIRSVAGNIEANKNKFQPQPD